MTSDLSSCSMIALCPQDMFEIVFNPPTSQVSLESQIESLQTTLASLNQKIISLQEEVQERDRKITQLEDMLTAAHPETVNIPPRVASLVEPVPSRADDTLTIVGGLIKLYKFTFPTGEEQSAPINK